MLGSSVVHMSFDEAPVSPADALTRWVRYLPHAVLTVVSTVMGIGVAFVIGALVLVTGRRPERLVALQVFAVRERLRTFGYFFLLRHDWPGMPSLDPTQDEDPYVQVTVRPVAELGRLEPVKRLVLVVPALVVGVPIGIVMDGLYPVLVVVAAARGRVPIGWARQLVTVEEWVGRSFLYLYLGSDDRPPLVPQLTAGADVTAALAT